MNYFDYYSVAREARLSDDELDMVANRVRSDFPFDEMMYELHVLRAFMAIRDGFITLEDALQLEPEGPK